MSIFLTVAEIAEHLRIRPRKVYALVASGEIPHRRAGARLIFDRDEIDAWLRDRSESAPHQPGRPPAVIAGSHDPLLEWAVRASGVPLALLTRGSRDGLAQMAGAEACAAALHMPWVTGQSGPAAGSGNAAEVARVGAAQPWVLLGWATRRQGLVVAPGNPLAIRGMDDLERIRAKRIGRRQRGAGSRELFDSLLHQAGLDGTLGTRDFIDELASEDDVARAVKEGRIACGLAIEAVAHDYGLGFIGLVDEEVDLLVDRASFFDAPLQALFAFARSREFKERARALPGYSIARLGEVVWNA